MRKLNIAVLVFTAVWGCLFALVSMLVKPEPELVLPSAEGRDTVASVKAGRTYYVMQVTKGSLPSKTKVGPGDIAFRWRDTGAEALGDLKIRDSALDMQEKHGEEIVRSRKGILSLVPARDGELAISCKLGGDFFLGVMPGFAALVITISATGAAAVIITALGLRYWNRRQQSKTRLV